MIKEKKCTFKNIKFCYEKKGKSEFLKNSLIQECQNIALQRKQY